jgi:hypothetical protein
VFPPEREAEAIRALRAAFLPAGRSGCRDDTGYMRRVVPGYQRKQPRW